MSKKPTTPKKPASGKFVLPPPAHIPPSRQKPIRKPIRKPKK